MAISKTKTTRKRVTKPTLQKPKMVEKHKPGISIDCDKLAEACLLFAFHESSKCKYQLRMAESGLSTNPTSARQRIAGLKTFFNDKLSTMKQIYDSAVSTNNKTKRIPLEINVALIPYYSDNTNSKAPEGFTWPSKE